MWINVNVILCVTMARLGYTSQAKLISDRLVHLLAQDLRTTGTWHEAYSSADGSSLAAPGFLSWNTLGARCVAGVRAHGRRAVTLAPYLQHHPTSAGG